MVLQGGTAVVNVVANGAALASSISGAVTTATQRVGRNLQASGLAMTKFLTVPLAALGAVSTKLALDFDTTFTKIEALASGVGEPLNKAREDVLKLAHATGQDPGGLAEALYFTASAGLAVEQVMPVLRASARAAATGMGEASDNAKLLTTVLHDYEGTGLSAANAMNILTRAIQLGKAEPQEFAQSIGQVIPFAANLGISFEDVAAAMSQISNSGLEFSRGVTGLRFLMSALNNPTEEAKDVFKDFGFEIGEFQKKLQTSGGFLRVMQEFATSFDLTTVAGRAAFATITGGARGAAAAAALVGTNAASAAELWRGVGKAAQDGATTARDALKIMEERPEFKFQQALADLKVAAIELGNVLVPILVEDVLPAIEDVVKFFRGLGDGTKKTIVQIGLLAAAFGPLLAVFGSVIRLGASVVGGIIRMGTAAAAANAAASGFVQTTLPGIGAAATAATIPLAPLIVGIAAVAVGVGLLVKSQHDYDDAVATNIEALHTQQDALETLQAQMDATHFDPGNVVLPDRRKIAEATAALEAYRGEMTALVNAQHISDAGMLGWLTTLLKTEPFTKRQAERLAALVGGFDNYGVALDENQQHMINNLIKMGDFQGAMKLTRQFLKDLTDADWRVNVTTKAETAALDALNTKMRGLGFHQTQGGEWLMNASVLVHARPNSPWPWEIIEDGLKSVGFLEGNGKGSGGGFTGTSAFHMDVVIQTHSDFEHVQSRLETLLPLIREAAGEGAADQARAFARDLSKLEKQFDKLKTKALDFRDAIRGAFSDSADLIGTIGDELARFRQEQEGFLQAQTEGTLEPGQTAPVAPDIASLIASQVAQAQQLASLLKQLQRDGLNVANLTDLAGQGAGAIPIAQALLDNPALIDQLNQAQESIAKITQQTADKMTQAAFGDKLLKMSGALDRLLEKLEHFLDGLHPEKINDKNREFVDALDHLIHAINNATGQIGGGGGNNNGGGNGRGITVNVFGGGGEATARAVREELLRIGRNNGGDWPVTLTVPNDSDPAYFDTEFQSRIFQADLEILQMAIGGRNGVIFGCGVTPDSPASMLVTVAAGAVAADAQTADITGGDIVISDADADPRFDLIIARDNDTVDVLQGTPDASPLMRSPLEVPGSVALAQVFVPVGATAIAENLIVPKSVLVDAPFNENLGWDTITDPFDRARSNTATLAVDDALQITLAANTKYRIRGYMQFKHTVGTATQTVKFGIGGPASPTHLYGHIAVRQGGAPTGFGSNLNDFLGYFGVFNTTTGLAAGNLSTYPTLLTTGYTATFEFDAIVHNGVNSGTFAPWWSQTVASAAVTMTRMAGSYIEYSVV